MLPLSMWANAQGLPSRRYTDMGSPRAHLEAQIQKLVMLPLMLSKAILVLPVLAFFRKTSLIWSVKCRWKINQGKRPSTWTAGYHFLPKLSYGMCSVQQSVTDDKGLCHGIPELVLKKKDCEVFPCPTKPAWRRRTTSICGMGVIICTHRSSPSLTRDWLLPHMAVYRGQDSSYQTLATLYEHLIWIRANWIWANCKDLSKQAKGTFSRRNIFY